MPRYTDYDKSIALELVARNGGVLDASTLKQIRKALGNHALPDQTIRAWMAAYEKAQTKLTESRVNLSDQKKPSIEAVTAEAVIVEREVAAQNLDALFEEVAFKLVKHVLKEGVIDKMNGSQAMVAAGIAVDKMRLLRDLPTEIIGILPVIMIELQSAGIDPVQYFTATQKRLEQARIDRERRSTVG